LADRLAFYLTLVESSSYRDFLRRWMAAGGRSGKPLTFGEAARRCRFESRSFLSDVLAGRRSLSEQSLKKLTAGFFDLPDVLIKIFLALVHSEEAELLPPGVTPERVERKLHALRQRAFRVFQRHDKELPTNSIDVLIQQPLFHLAYAAMGLGEQGEAFADLLRKTSSTATDMKPILADMISCGFVEVFSDSSTESVAGDDFTDTSLRYRAKDAHRILEGLASPGAFHSFIVNWISFIVAQVQRQPPDPKELFNVSTFTIRTGEFPEMRKRLVDAIDALVEEFGTVVGDDLVRLTVCLSPSLSESSP
jgi:hypothetical protein